MSGAMEDLDALVTKYAHQNLERDGVVTAWVLCVATTNYDDDGDVGYAYDYSVSPSSDLIRSVGLIELARLAMHRDISSTGSDD
jgi:hypothetical protein